MFAPTNWDATPAATVPAAVHRRPTELGVLEEATAVSAVQAFAAPVAVLAENEVAVPMVVVGVSRMGWIFSVQAAEVFAVVSMQIPG